MSDNKEIQGDDLLMNIRKRPGMYTGGTDKMGLHHLLFWALDDILNNVRAGRGTMVRVSLHKDGSCEVYDDGPAVRDQEIATAAEVDALTKSFPQKLPKRGDVSAVHCRSYLVILRALSRLLNVNVEYEHKGFSLTYRQDGNEPNTEHSQLRRIESGFTTRFYPDPEIFSDTTFDLDLVRNRLRQMAATCSGLRCELRCNKLDLQEDLTCPNGTADLLKAMTEDFGFFPEEPFRVTVSEPGRSLDVAILWPWTNHDKLPTKLPKRLASWVNSVRTSEGTHVLGLLDALRSAGALRPYPVAVLSVFLPAPRLSSPIKDVLSNPEMRRFVSDHVGAALRRLVELDPEFAMQLELDPIPTHAELKTSSTGS